MSANVLKISSHTPKVHEEAFISLKNESNVGYADEGGALVPPRISIANDALRTVYFYGKSEAIHSR